MNIKQENIEKVNEYIASLEKLGAWNDAACVSQTLRILGITGKETTTNGIRWSEVDRNVWVSDPYGDFRAQVEPSIPGSAGSYLVCFWNDGYDTIVASPIDGMEFHDLEKAFDAASVFLRYYANEA